MWESEESVQELSPLIIQENQFKSIKNLIRKKKSDQEVKFRIKCYICKKKIHLFGLLTCGHFLCFDCCPKEEGFHCCVKCKKNIYSVKKIEKKNLEKFIETNNGPFLKDLS